MSLKSIISSSSSIYISESYFSLSYLKLQYLCWLIISLDCNKSSV